MKHFAVIILVALIAFLSFNDVINYGLFYLNQDSIAAKHCVNLDKPKMQCKGKCYLKKTIEKKQEQEEETPFPVQENRPTVVFIFDQLISLFSEATIMIKGSILWLFINDYSFSYVQDIFHPPKS